MLNDNNTVKITKSGKIILFEWPDTDDSWEIRSYLPVALEREFVQHAIDAQETLTNLEPSLIISLAERMDILVVKSTLNWSYGPVNLDTFYNEVPGHEYADVAMEVGKCYSPLVVRNIEMGLEAYTLHLNQKEMSQ